MVAITLEGVTVRYGGRDGTNALDDLTLQVASGELVVLTGPSGSGKTTVLRTIAGLERPVRGVVRFDGVDVTDVDAGARDVALVSEYNSLFPHLDVAQNLGFALRVRRLPAEETARRVQAEARVLGLAAKLRRRPRDLSSGERQKAALGRATARRPRIYLLDEPLAGLDAGERERIRREFQQLQRGLGVTTVYVTHDQRDAMAIGDRIAVIDRGRLLQVADPMTLYDAPVDLFVARFFGAPPLGVLRGRMHDDGSTAWVDVAGTAVRLLPAQRAAVTAGGHGPALVLGMRAAAVTLDGDDRPPWARRLEVVVRNVEPTGAATVLALTPLGADGAPSPDMIYATVPPVGRRRLGQRCDVTIDLRRCMVFDGDSGQRLTSADRHTQ